VLFKKKTKEIKKFWPTKNSNKQQKLSKANQLPLIHNVLQHLKKKLVDKEEDCFFHIQKP